MQTRPEAEAVEEVGCTREQASETSESRSGKNMGRLGYSCRAVGDVVYMMEKDDDDEFCRMGVVEEVKAGPDGCIRTATVRYTNPGGDPHQRSAPKLAVRPIHKLAVIVPVDYRFEEDLAMEQAESRENAKRGAAKERHGIKEYNPDLEKNSQESRPKREAARKAMDALKRGADATRGRGRRRGRVYQRAGNRN